MPSSVIHGMRYMPERKELDIVFLGTGGTYRYFDVGPEDWKAFRQAPSKGTYLNAVFKGKHPRYIRVAAVGTGVLRFLQASGPMSSRDLPDENVWGFFETTL